MTDAAHSNPFVTIALSMGLGVASWLADPDVYRALAVALACGFIGGVARAAGVAAYNTFKERKGAKKG